MNAETRGNARVFSCGANCTIYRTNAIPVPIRRTVFAQRWARRVLLQVHHATCKGSRHFEPGAQEPGPQLQCEAGSEAACRSRDILSAVLQASRAVGRAGDQPRVLLRRSGFRAGLNSGAGPLPPHVHKLQHPSHQPRAHPQSRRRVCRLRARTRTATLR